MRKFGWLSAIMIWTILGCGSDNILSPSVKSIDMVEQNGRTLTEPWIIYGTVTNVFGQPVAGAPIYIVVNYINIDSTAFFLVHTNDRGEYYFEEIFYIYGITVTVKSTCIQSEPPETVLTRPEWDWGDIFPSSEVNFQINLPYCAPILE